MSTSTVVTPTLSLERLQTAAEPLVVQATEPRKPRVWTAFATLLLAVIAGQLAVFFAAIVVGFGSGVVLGAMGNDQGAIQSQIQSIFQNPLVSLIVTLLPFQLMMALAVVFAVRRSKETFKKRVGLLPPSGRKVGIVKLTALAAFTLSTALGLAIVSMIYGGLPLPTNSISAAVASGSVWAMLLVSLLISIVPALVEETLFRGYLQRRFLERWSPAAAIGVTTLLFAVMHFDSLTHIVSIIPLGFVTGLLAYRTNSVKPGMAVHALHNVGTVMYTALVMTFGPMVAAETLGFIIIGTLIALGLFGLPAVISLLRSGKRGIATDTVLETAADATAVNRREANEPDYAFDSQLASAV